MSRPVLLVSRVRMDHRGRELGQGMHQVVLAVVCDAMCRNQTQRRIDVEFGVGMQAVADPAHPHAVHRPHSRWPASAASAVSTSVGIDAVDQATEYVAHGRPQHGEDGHGDDQPDDRVGEREAQCHTAGADQHGQRGEPVGAGVQAVGDQRG